MLHSIYMRQYIHPILSLKMLSKGRNPDRIKVGERIETSRYNSYLTAIMPLRQKILQKHPSFLEFSIQHWKEIRFHTVLIDSWIRETVVSCLETNPITYREMTTC